MEERGGTQRAAGRARYGWRLAAWAMAATVVSAVLGTAGPQSVAPAEVRLIAASFADLSPEEQQLLALMDPADRARYLLQKRIAEKAETAALLADLQAKRHDTAKSVIDNIR
jgi:hypothetical protein